MNERGKFVLAAVSLCDNKIPTAFDKLWSKVWLFVTHVQTHTGGSFCSEAVGEFSVQSMRPLSLKLNEIPSAPQLHALLPTSSSGGQRCNEEALVVQRRLEVRLHFWLHDSTGAQFVRE